MSCNVGIIHYYALYYSERHYKRLMKYLYFFYCNYCKALWQVRKRALTGEEIQQVLAESDSDFSDVGEGDSVQDPDFVTADFTSDDEGRNDDTLITVETCDLKESCPPSAIIPVDHQDNTQVQNQQYFVPTNKRSVV